MDLTTILGILSGAGLIIWGIELDNLGNFISPSSLAITLGGTIAGLVASFPVSTLKQIPKHLKIVMSGRKYKPMTYIDIIVDFAQIARKNGLLALEEQANEQSDPFLRDSILLIVDAIDADKVKQMLEDDMAYLDARHQDATSFYSKGEAFAPAFGMIGTLIGLINMLKSMNFDGGGASELGEGMSVALITTFYGTVLANLIFSPIANKLMLRHEEEMLCKQIIMEGVLSIQSGENPKFIREKLISFLPRKERDAAGEGGEGGEGDGEKPKKEKKAKKEKKEKK